MNLYELTQETESKLQQLGELLENGETPTDEQVFSLLELQENTAEKLKNYGFVVKNLDGDIDALSAEIKRLTDRKRALANKQERLKNTMLFAMQTTNINKVDDPVMPLRLQNGAPSVRLDVDVENLPSEYQKIKKEADRTALAKALKAGILIDGVVLETKQHIRIG